MRLLISLLLLVFVGCQCCGCDRGAKDPPPAWGKEQAEPYTANKAPITAEDPDPEVLGEFREFGEKRSRFRLDLPDVPDWMPEAEIDTGEAKIRLGERKAHRSLLAGALERPEVHVYQTASCPACRRLARDVARNERLADFTWRFYGADQAPRDLRLYPTLYFEGADGWYKVEGWQGADWFLSAYRRVQGE